MLFPKAFAGIFSSDSELVGFAAKALRIYLGGMFLMGCLLYTSLRGDKIPDSLRIIRLSDVFDFLAPYGDYTFTVDIKNDGPVPPDPGQNGAPDRKSTRLNSSHSRASRMPSSA